jgi:toxin ParE1/3/4
MGYLVRFSARAGRDLESLFEEIHADQSTAALKWYAGLKKAILSMEETPNRCPYAQESKKLRNLLYGKKPHIYRVIYRIVETEKLVDILHIRHGARRPARLK